MNRDPFGETPFDRMMRLERERSRMLKQASVPMRSLGEASGLETLAALSKYESSIANSFKHLTDSPTMKLARDMQAQWKDIGSVFDGVLRETAASASIWKGMRLATASAVASRPIVDTSVAAKVLSDLHKQITEATRPLSALFDDMRRQQAEFGSLFSQIDKTHWREFASVTEAFRQSFLMHAENVAAWQAGSDGTIGLANALAEIEIPQQLPEASALLALFAAIFAAVQKLIDNTPGELRSMGLLTASGWLAGIVGLLIALQDAPGLTPQQERELTEAHEAIVKVDERLAEMLAAEAREHEYIAALPKAAVVRPARVREAPNRKARLITRLPNQTVVGIADRHERWVKAVFRDEMTGELQEGWIYGPSVQQLGPDDIRAQ